MVEEDLRRQIEENLSREADKRRFIYKDVEVLISENFLTESVLLTDIHVVLRSTLPQDLIVLRTQEILPDKDYLRWFVCHHVYMLNGMVLPTDKSENSAFSLFHGGFSDLQDEIIEVLFYAVLGLRNRVMRAINIVEAFCYERYSRTYWNTLGKEGVSWGNANTCVKIWRTYNQIQDLNEADEQQWQHTRVVSGSMSKGASEAVEKFLKESRRKQEEYRRKVIERAVNWVIYGDPKEEKKAPLKVKVGDKLYDMPTTKGAQTAEELIDEMKKVMSGEKDFHDILVEEYQEKIRKKRQELIEERRRKVEEAIKKREEQEITGGTILAGYTAEQLERTGKGNKPTQKVSDNMESYLYDRFFAPEIKVGVLGKQGPEEANKENTKEKEKGSLQQKIQKRDPTFKNN